MFIGAIPQMSVFFKIKLDLLCLVLCSLENKWEHKRTHTHTHTHRGDCMLTIYFYVTSDWVDNTCLIMLQNIGSFPQKQSLRQTLACKLFIQRCDLKRQKLEASWKEERTGKSQHKDALLSWPLLYKTGCGIMCDAHVVHQGGKPWWTGAGPGVSGLGGCACGLWWAPASFSLLPGAPVGLWLTLSVLLLMKRKIPKKILFP